MIPTLSAMSRFWQAIVIFLVLSAPIIRAAEEKRQFTWNPPKTGRGLFTNDLGMLDREREEYATNLANLAANTVSRNKASLASLEEARRLIALALHISPRNRRALVVNFQLAKSIIPEPAQGDYSREVFARLLLTRGQLLEKQGGAQNSLLARTFIELAAEMDPKNEDAVYASEVQRLDHGRVDWKTYTDAPEPPDSEEPKPAAPPPR
jgi:hypothetical protein